MKMKIVISIILVIVVLITATTFSAVAEEYEYIPAYTIEMGTITAFHSTLNT